MVDLSKKQEGAGENPLTAYGDDKLIIMSISVVIFANMHIDYRQEPEGFRIVSAIVKNPDLQAVEAPGIIKDSNRDAG